MILANRFSLLLVLVALIGELAYAHDSGLSSAEIRVQANTIEAELRFARSDVEALGGSNRSPSELLANMESLVGGRLLQLRFDGTAIVTTGVSASFPENDVFAVRLRYQRPVGKAMQVVVPVFGAFARGHRQYAKIVAQDGSLLSEKMLSASDHAIQSTLGEHARGARGLAGFVGQGVWHIWIGYDHIAFLLLLLLPIVLARRDIPYECAPSVVESVWRVLRVVTAFTLAHSITLSLAALDIVHVPSRPVEIAIAASVIAAGLSNLIRSGHRFGVPMAFAFGLLHGFGFAGALSALGVRPGEAVIPLLGFNLGVEVGQLAIVAITFPVMVLLRRTPVYRRLIVPAGSMAMAAWASLWLLERAA